MKKIIFILLLVFNSTITFGQIFEGFNTYNVYSFTFATELGTPDACTNIYRSTGIGISGGLYGGSTRYDYIFRKNNIWYQARQYQYSTPPPYPTFIDTKTLSPYFTVSPPCTALWINGTRTFTGTCGILPSGPGVSSGALITTTHIDNAKNDEASLASVAQNDGRMIFNTCTNELILSKNGAWNQIYSGGLLDVSGNLTVQQNAQIVGKMQLNGAFIRKTVQVFSNYTVADNDNVIIMGSGTTSIYFNPSIRALGKELIFYNNSGGSVIFNLLGVGASAGSFIGFSGTLLNNEKLILITDGSSWYKVN